MDLFFRASGRNGLADYFLRDGVLVRVRIGVDVVFTALGEKENNLALNTGGGGGQLLWRGDLTSF